MKTLCRLTVLVLMTCSGALSQTQETAYLQYSDVYRAVSGVMKMPMFTNQVIRLTVKSNLPGVRTSDITLYIDSRSGRIPVPLATDGAIQLPESDVLLEENPRIVANQPKGSLSLKGEVETKIDHKGPVFIAGDRQRYKSLFFIQGLKDSLVNSDFGDLGVGAAVSNTVIAVYLIPKQNPDNAVVVVESGIQNITIPRDTDGTFHLRYDEQLAKDNPWVLMPSNHAWTVTAALQE